MVKHCAHTKYAGLPLHRKDNATDKYYGALPLGLLQAAGILTRGAPRVSSGQCNTPTSRGNVAILKIADFPDDSARYYVLSQRSNCWRES